ncbi:aminotransferase class III-fold pyridoxal phosphate-dependent enzyme [Alkalihalobacillus sp. NPDC078783]
MTYPYIVPIEFDHQKDLILTNIVSAKNEYLYDSFGKRHLDLRTGLWNISLGYQEDYLNLIQQSFEHSVKKGMFYLDLRCLSTDIYSEYALNLLEFANEESAHFSKVFFTNSGSEGTEIALKVTHKLTSRKEILAFQDGYHGTYFGGMSVSGVDVELSRSYLNVQDYVTFFEIPTTDEAKSKLTHHIMTNGENIGAFIFEPVLGSGGTQTLDINYLNHLLDLCKQKQIITIFDEVATGFYKTGTRFFYNHLNIKPDILILGKTINNGILPFGTVIIGERVNQLLKKSLIEHFSTQNGNILAIQTANVTLNYLLQHESSIINNIQYIDNVIRTTLEEYNVPFNGTGVMYSIPIDSSITTELVYNHLEKLGVLVSQYAFTEWGHHRSGISIFPPYFLDFKKFKQALQLIAKTINSYPNLRR